MRVAEDCLITVQQRITDENDVAFDIGTEQLCYIHGGYNRTLAKVEAALEGKEVGESVSVLLSPAESFGAYDPEKRVVAELSQFHVRPNIGDVVCRDDQQEPCTVVEITDSSVILEGNHPLAGLSLIFHLTVTDIRPATEQEIINADSGCLTASVKTLRAIKYGLTTLLLIPLGVIMIAGFIEEVAGDGIITAISLIILLLILLFGLWTGFVSLRNAFRKGEMLRLSQKGLIWRLHDPNQIPWSRVESVKRTGSEGDCDYLVSLTDRTFFSISTPILNVEQQDIGQAFLHYLGPDKVTGL